MSHNSAAEVQIDASDLGAIGAKAALPISGGFANYQPISQMVSGHTQDVILEKDPETKRKEFAVQEDVKADKKLMSLQAAAPTAPKGQQPAAAFQKHGMQLQHRMMSRFDRRPPNAYAILNARTAVASPTMKPAALKVKEALPETMTVKVTSLKVTPPPKPAPKKPSYAESAKRWSASAGYIPQLAFG